MAYEYNPESSRFEVANPHKVENWFLGGIGAVCLIGAIAALMIGRHALSQSLSAGAIRPILIAVFLLVFAVVIGQRAMSQLRFFFGRNQPANLSSHTGPSGNERVDGEWLRETLRQNAIGFPVPAGPLNTLLYSLVKDLVFAPPRTQDLARIEFRNTLTLGVLMLCFGISMIGVGSVAVREWISFFYFVLAVALVIAPLGRGEIRTSRMSQGLFIGLIVAVAIAPVLLPYLVGKGYSPFHRWIQLPAVTMVVLVCALAASTLLFVAAIAQIVKPHRIAMAQHLQSLSMNAPPNQIFIEFDREMQRGWTEKIPNRIYLRDVPVTEGDNGSFDGQALEESQPIPQDSQPLTFSRCLALPSYRWLLVLDAVGLLIAIVGTGMLVNYAGQPNNLGALVMGSAMLLIARFACFGGNRLWRRFEFTSRIVWLECHGNFQRAKSSIGAMLQDRVKTEKSLVNVEDMTLRVWVAEVDSVSFGPDAWRSLLSIRGLPEEAERLAAHLAQKASDQAMVVSPQSQADLQRLNVLNKLNPSSAAPLPAAAVQALGGGAAGGGSPNVPAATGKRFCSQCGAPAAAGAQFCAQCGASMKG